VAVVSVVIPSYRRPDDLTRCLAGLARQSLAPVETIVVRRTGDRATEAVIRGRLPAVVDVVVDEPGVLAAMGAGVAAAQADIVAFIDDDAVARADWLRRLTRHFDHDSVGGVGGRDVICRAGRPESTTLDVGRITAWGKLVGNHHRGGGAPREVMVLKAAGMAFRRAALALPRGLRGQGAQAHFEVGLSLSARRRGWRLIYDPTAVVDHYVAPRFDADRRERPDPVAVQNAAYNLVTCLLTEAPDLFWRRAAYGLLIGDRGMPGLLRAAVALIRDEPDVMRDLRPSLAGQAAALQRAAARRQRSRGASRGSDGQPNRKPRVALVAHDVHAEGGMERACLELVTRASAEVDFTVLSARIDPALRCAVRWRRVPVPQRPFPLKFAAFYVLAAARLAFERVDLVHTVGAIVPLRVDVASVHYCHGAFDALASGATAHASLARRLNAWLSRTMALVTERWSYRPGRVRVLAAVSDGVARELDAYYPGIDTVVTMNGVDPCRFRPDRRVREEMRARMAVAPESCVALFVGGDWDRKGLAEAIGGVAYARGRGASITLWVVGPGDRTRFQALARRRGVADEVVFFGHRGDTESFYRAADVFVLPTLYETFCLAAFEAAVAGLPVVVTRVHGAVDLVGDGAAGICVERTPEAVGAALVRLASDADLRASLGAAGCDRSHQYPWRRSVDAVLAVYARLLTPVS
jgi:glycosyltransferase involved in cell wall biosynthesis/GT2 family glycosyltransferase